jgi:regulator of replication initiation timing
MNCDICKTVQAAPFIGFCLHCGWDASENGTKKKLYQKVFEQAEKLKKEVGQQAQATKALQKQLKTDETEVLRLENVLKQAQLQKEQLEQRVQAQQQQEAQLKELSEKLASFNYLLDNLGQADKKKYLNRAISLKQVEPLEFSLSVNFDAPIQLLWVLSKQKTMITGDATVFVVLDELLQGQGRQQKVCLPKPKDLTGSYWGFFTTFHGNEKARVEPAMPYKFDF